MSANFYDLMKYAKTGIALPDMTGYDKMKALALFGGAEQTLTGIPPLTFKADGTPLISWSMKGNGSQQGTPTPDNPVMPEFVGVRTANLWDKGVPIYAYATDYKKYNANNAIALKAGTYTFSSDGILPQIQAFHADLSPYTDIRDVIQNDSALYAAWDNRALLPFGNTFRRTTIVIAEDCIITICCNSTYIGTYIMLNSGSTALPFEPFGYKIPITCAGQTVPVYLGQTQTVRRIKKLVLDGVNDGEWKKSSTRKGSFYLNVGTNAIVSLGLCDRAVNVNTVNQYDSIGQMLVESSGLSKLINLWLFDTNISLDDFKSYLAAQYAAGTPVTVWYVLANEQTGIVNEPLCKIGDYADELSSEDAGVSIPTIKGQNVLTVDTPIQPSEMTITFKG